MSKTKNFDAYQGKLNASFDKAYDRAIKQVDPVEAPLRPYTRPVFGTVPNVPVSGSGSGPKYPTVDLNDQYLKELDDFVKLVLSQVDTFKRNEPGPEAVRRVFDEWVAKLNYLKQNNPVQVKVIDIAIKNLWSLYKNEVKKGADKGKQEDKGNLRLRLAMFADVHWWDKVRSIFVELNKYIQRSFVRPVVVQLPKPGTAPRVEAPNPNDYTRNPTTGNLERVYSKDKLVIIDAIRKYAIRVILVSKNVQTNIASVESILPLYERAIAALIGEEIKIAAEWRSTFKAMKINLHFLNKVRNAVDDPYDDVIMERLEKEKKYAEGIVKNTPERIKPTMAIYGSKLENYNGKADDYGFRPRQTGEGNDVYDMRMEIYRIYGDGYNQYQLKLYTDKINERKRQQAEIDNELDKRAKREKVPFSTTPPGTVLEEGRSDLEQYLAKGNYIDPSHVVFGTRVSATYFRKYDDKVDATQAIYDARATIWLLWSKAFRIQLAKFNDLIAELKKAQAVSKADIPDIYEGTPINSGKFRGYNLKLDNNMNFYLIKKRIWTIYHSYQIAYENDIVIGGFQKLYDKTVDFVDGLISSIEQISKDPKSLGVLGSSGSPILNNFDNMIDGIEEFNQTFTTSPWSKSFILDTNMLAAGSDNDYVNRLNNIKNDLSAFNVDLNMIMDTIKQETDALQVMVRSIEKVNPDKTNPFLEYYKDIDLPENNSTTAIAQYIDKFLTTIRDPQYDAYGISYILGQI